MDANITYQLVSDGISIALLLIISAATLRRICLDLKPKARSKSADSES